MTASKRVFLAAGLDPSTVGPLRNSLKSWGQLEVCTQLRDTMDQVKRHRPSLVILPADRGAGLAACDRLRADDSLGEPLVWLLSESGLTARLAAHWLRPTRAHFYGTLPLSPQFFTQEVLPLLPETSDAASPRARTEPGEPIYAGQLQSSAEGLEDPHTDDTFHSNRQPTEQRLRDRLEATRSKLRAAEKRQSETNEKLAQMRKSLAAAHADLANRHTDLRSASDMSQRERQRVEQLEDELDLASRQQDSLRATAAKEVERLQAELRAAQEQVRASKKQLETEQGALTTQLSRSRTELLETESNNTALRKKLDELKKRESTLRQSLQVTRTATEADARRKAQEVANLEAVLTQTRQRASQATLLEARITELEAELVQARTAKSRAQSAHQSAAERFEFGEQSRQKEADSLRAELASVSEHAQGTLKALNAARHAQAEVERLQARWSTERQRLEKERNEAQAKLAEMASGSSNERAQLRSMSGAATQIRNERDALEARQVTLHATIDRLENELARAKEGLSQVTRERDGFRANREELAGSQSHLQSQLNLAEEERDELRTEQQSLRVQLREWHNDYEHLKRERDSLRDERNRLTEQHLPLVNDRNRLRDDLSPIRDERDAAIEALAENQAFLTQLKSDLATERERIIEYELLLDREPTDYGKDDTVTPAGRWHEALSNTRISNERLRTEVAHLRDELNTLSSKLQETTTANRALDRRLTAAQHEATEAQKQQIQDLDWFMETLRVVQKS